MTAKRTLRLLTAALVLAAAAVLVFLWTNLDRIVASAIEHYGSKATGTAVRVSRVALRPLQGTGAIEGLTVANPRGYASPHLLSLGGIRLSLAARTTASNPVVIDDIRVSAPLVVYELNDDGVANIDVLRKNLAADRPQRTGDTGTTAGERRIRIRRLVIENARIEVRIAAFGDKPRSLMLSRIEMANIGGTNGAPPEEAAKQIVSAVLSDVSREVITAGAARLLDNAFERVLRRK
jgi:hypothetical protein